MMTVFLVLDKNLDYTLVCDSLASAAYHGRVNYEVLVTRAEKFKHVLWDDSQCCITRTVIQSYGTYVSLSRREISNSQST
jgi:hypothetical protein